MKFLKKYSDSTFVIKTNVKANSKTQKIINNNEFLTMFLRSKPIKNKANKELINLLRKKLNISSNQIQIISGVKSTIKLVKITFFRNIEEQDIICTLINE